MMRIILSLTLFCLLQGTLTAEDEKKPVQEEKTSKEAKLSYLLYLPPDYEKAEKPVPLMIFLHGAGERGDNLSQVKRHGPPKLVEKGKKFPFVLVSPQCPRNSWWNPESLTKLLDEIVSTHKIDKSRIYVTGLSMGGFGSWALGAAIPDRIAAIAPICGGGEPRSAAKLKGMPIWAFHGGKDTVVRPERSEVMVEAVKKAGNKDIKLTIYSEAGHDSWTKAYDDPELYEWFLKQGGEKKE